MKSILLDMKLAKHLIACVHAMFFCLVIAYAFISLHASNYPHLCSGAGDLIDIYNLFHRNVTAGKETTDNESSSAQNVFTMSKSNPLPEHTQFNHTAYVKKVKSMSSLQELHQKTCSQTCTRQRPTVMCSTLECIECSCIWPHCDLYGLCCPDIAQNLEDTVSLYANRSLGDQVSEGPTQPIHYGRSVRPKLGCEMNTEKPFVFIKSCSKESFADEHTRRLCEEDDALDEFNLGNVCRVVDKATGVVYRNKFCALCNGATKVLNFGIELKCKNFMSVFMATEEDELIRLAAKKDSNCFLFQTVSFGVTTISCREGQFDRNVVDTCNSSVSNDPDIELACTELSGSVNQRFYPSTGTFFKNLFCALCNKVIIIEQNLCSPGPAVRPWFAALPLSLLFSNERAAFNTLTLHDNCLGAEFLYFTDECLPLNCSPGKRLKNGTCTTVFQDIELLGYSIQLWAIPEFLSTEHSIEVQNSSVLAENLSCQVAELIRDLSHYFYIDIISITPNAVSCSANVKLNQCDHYLIDCKLVAGFMLKRDDVERDLVDIFINRPVTVQLDNERKVVFRPYFVTGQFDINDHCTRFNHNITCSSLAKYNKTSSYQIDGMSLEAYTFLRLTHTLTCIHISLNASRYAIRTDTRALPPRVTVIINFNVTKLVLSDVSDLNLLEVDGNGFLNVCLELLKRKKTEMTTILQNFEMTSDVSQTTVTQYILTVAFMMTSILCLLFTLVTYCRFEVLQNAAGRNNILLCTSLMAAQIVLLVAAHLTGPSPLCTAVGMTTHFLWLWMFSWTFICCFHMFKVFTAKTRSVIISPQSQIRQMVKKITGSIVFSATVVTAVIVTSLIRTDGGQTGYGETTCFLNSHMLRNIGVIGPLAGILSSNIVCFLITVYKIHMGRMRQTSAAMKREDNMNLYVYIKLSSMTGAFWTMAIISERWDNDILRFLSIILNGLQGVFIFLSFICNKRILHLYMSRLRREDFIYGASDSRK